MTTEITLKHRQTRVGFALGSYIKPNKPEYKLIRFHAKGHINREDFWSNTPNYYLDTLAITLENDRSPHKFCVFKVEYCKGPKENNKFRIHVAGSRDEKNLEHTKKSIVFNSNLTNKMSLEEKSDNKVYVEFVAYLFEKRGDHKVIDCDNKATDEDVPFKNIKETKAFDVDLLSETGLQPDVKKGNILVGKN